MHATLRNILLTVLLLGLLSSGGLAQTLPPKLSIFKPDEYGGHHQIMCTMPLPDGRTAFGSSSKFLIHHGEGFTKIPIGNGRTVNSMDLDSSGRIFVGGRSIMGAIVPDSTGNLVLRSLIHHLPDSLKDLGIVWNTICTPKGEVYFNNKEHLFRYDGDSIKVLEPKAIFYRLFQPSGRPVVYDVGSGLFRLEGTHREYLRGSKELTRRKAVYAILPAPDDQKGSWLVFTIKNGIYHYDPSTGEWGPFPAKERAFDLELLRKEHIYSVCRLDPSKNSYGAAYGIGTLKGGVHLIDPQGRRVLGINSGMGLPSDKIWQVVPDGRGDLWAGTDHGIALIKIGQPFRKVEKGKLFKGDVDKLLRPDLGSEGFYPKGTPLFLANSHGVWKWQEQGAKFSRLEGIEHECFDMFPYLRSERDARLLVASHGIYSVPVGTESQNKSVETKFLPSELTYSLKQIKVPEGTRRVLAGGRKALRVFSDPSRDKAMDTLLVVQEIPGAIKYIGWERSDSSPDSLRLWGGTASNGVLSVKTDTGFTGYHFHHYDTAHGLPKGEVRVFSDLLQGGPDVVFGTEKGLYRFDEGEFHPDDRYGSSFAGDNDQIYGMEKGLRDEIWILEESGGQIRHLKPENKASFQVDSSIFRSLDLGTISSILQEEGVTWIGGSKGLASYHPKMATDLDKEWHCLIREVKGSGDSLLFGGAFTTTGDTGMGGNDLISAYPLDEQPREMVPVLPYTRNRMVFKFAAPFPDKQEAVKYSYKLVGFDDSWKEWTPKAQKEYTNIPEGDYTFKVKARNIYLKESSTAKYRFTILPPWYRTWGAYVAYSVAGIGLIWSIVWLNSRRLIAQKQRLEKIVDERTKEIREQKEKVEEQQRETEKQKEEVEKQKDIVEEAHREITQSIDYAQKIQFALLQPEEQVSTHLPEHFILFRPQSQVSGDFYWAKEHKGHLYIAAVDCTGHGVPGAFMSMLGISQLNEIMNTDQLLTPGYILTDLRDRVVRELSGSDPESAAKDGMDAALVRIPLGEEGKGKSEREEVQFAGAQNPLYVIRKGIVEEPPAASMEYQGKTLDEDPLRPFKKRSDGIEIKGDGQPVGHDEYAKDAFTTVSLQLWRGDMLYIFSDGYADQFGGPKGKKFRYGPFKELLASLHEKPLEEQKQELDKTFEDWKSQAGQEQIDDVVVIGVRL